MPYAYCEHLSELEKLVYRASDQVHALRLPGPRELRPLTSAIAQALERADAAAVEAAASRLCQAITQGLGVPRVEVAVLDVRPHDFFYDLHGLYTHEADGTPLIRVWVRTAKYRRTVAFRTFLRTLLHELCHHLDFTLLGLPLSFHTAGFFKRESSLFHQLVPPERAIPSPAGRG